MGGKDKSQRKEKNGEEEWEGGQEKWGGGVISHFEYNLIIMPTPLKMSRLLWESVISMAIMSFVAHEEWGRHWGTVPVLTQPLQAFTRV